MCETSSRVNSHYSLGDVFIVEHTAGHNETHLTPEDRLSLLLQVAHESHVTCNKDITVANVHDGFLWLHEQSHWLPHDKSHAVRIEVPRLHIMNRLPNLEKLDAVAFSTKIVPGSLLLAMARHFCHPDTEKGAHQVVEARLSDHMMDLIDMTLRSSVDLADFNDQRAWRRKRIREHIDRNLGDLTLTPQKIAEGHKISPRTLYQLFKDEPGAIAGWIATRRLEKAREALLDPYRQHISIADIARQHGFRNAAHFSRRFRSHFALSPRELRREGAKDDQH